MSVERLKTMHWMMWVLSAFVMAFFLTPRRHLAYAMSLITPAVNRGPYYWEENIQYAKRWGITAIIVASFVWWMAAMDIQHNRKLGVLVAYIHEWGVSALSYMPGSNMFALVFAATSVWLFFKGQAVAVELGDVSAEVRAQKKQINGLSDGVLTVLTQGYLDLILTHKAMLLHEAFRREAALKHHFSEAPSLELAGRIAQATDEAISRKKDFWAALNAARTLRPDVELRRSYADYLAEDAQGASASPQADRV